MSFGYSVGDFISGANLTYRLIRALSETCGAQVEYQEAILELAAIQNTFLEVGRMRQTSTVNQATINAASHIVLSATDLIGDFLERTKKYRKRFGNPGTGSSLSSGWQKVGWAMFKTEELKRLKDTLHVKLTNIGILLSVAQFYGPECDASPPVYRSEVSELKTSPTPLSKTPGEAAESPKEMEMSVKAPEVTPQKSDLTGSPEVLPGDTVIDTAMGPSNHLGRAEPKPKPKILRQKEDPKSKVPEIGGILDFIDFKGRKFVFPFGQCCTWKHNVLKGMRELIKEVCTNYRTLEPHIKAGHFDLKGTSGEIIIPSVWDKVIKPNMQVQMEMWPTSDNIGGPGKPTDMVIPVVQHKQKYSAGERPLSQTAKPAISTFLNPWAKQAIKPQRIPGTLQELLLEDKLMYGKVTGSKHDDINYEPFNLDALETRSEF